MYPLIKGDRVYLEEKYWIPLDLYEALADLRGQDIRRKASGMSPISMNVKARQLGIEAFTAKFLFARLDRLDRQMAEIQRQDSRRTSHDFEDKIARAPHEKPKLAAHRGPEGEVQWDGVPGYVDEKARIREEVSEMMAASAGA